MAEASATSAAPIAIGIIGGVGPMAGVELHRRIVALVATDGRDQDYPDILHVAQPAAIADRTAFLLGHTSDNPAAAMADMALRIVHYFETLGRGCVIGVPCNTFHAPPIFDVFLDRLGDVAKTVVNMLDVTLDQLAEDAKAGARIGVLTTTGTRANGVWQTRLNRCGFDVVQIDPADQPRLQAAIYDPVYGLKACSPASQTAVSIVRQQSRALLSQGADAVILGCSELPLAFAGQTVLDGTPLFDPITALARELIVRAGRTIVPSAPDRGQVARSAGINDVASE